MFGSPLNATLTPEQVLALAPGAGAAAASRELAAARKWVSLGRAPGAAWGECQGSAKLPYQTAVDLGGPAFKCSCPSRKLPCKHGLGLLLLLQEQPSAFVEGEPPEWVADWLAGRAKRAEARPKSDARPKADGPVDRAAQERRAARRGEQVAAGMADLERWLHDLVGQGLAAAQRQPPAFWNGPAARLVDAQAAGAARMVRELGAAAAGDGWQGRLLERIGRLYLLVQAHRRLDELPPAVREDVRGLLGWTRSQDDLLAAAGVRDHWAVLGRRVEDDGRLRTQRTWLWGRGSGRPALVLHFAHGGAPLDTTLVVGTAIDAELVFYPGAWPLRALVKERGAPLPLDGLPGAGPVAAALEAEAAALAANPWLEELPVVLGSVVPVPRGDGWALRDAASALLPLRPRYAGGWALRALSGGHPIDVFGEWDGEHLLPLGAWAEGAFCAV